MNILNTFISACGAAIVAGIFSLILAKKDAKKARKAEDNQIVQKVDALGEKFEAHILEDAAARADEARRRILRFGDEVRRGVLHTEEHWLDILLDVDRYEDYCESHPAYENNRATASIKYLKGVFDGRLEKNDFLK